MGQYGTIKKIIINKHSPFKNSREGLSYSAYVTFSSEIEAAAAILATDGKEFDNRTLKASFGLSKYCMSYIINNQCKNKGCPYMHKAAKEVDTFTKEEANSVEVLNKIHNHGAMDLLIKNYDKFVRMVRNRKSGLKFRGIKEVERIVRERYEELIGEGMSDNNIEEPEVKRVSCSEIANNDPVDNKLNKWASMEIEDNNSITELIESDNNKKCFNDNLENKINQINPEQSNKKQDLKKAISMNNTPRNQDLRSQLSDRLLSNIETIEYEDSLNLPAFNKKSIDTVLTDKSGSLTPSSINTAIKDNNSTTSTINTIKRSDDKLNKDSLGNLIKNSVSQKTNEYTYLDKLILGRLNEKYSKSSQQQKLTQKMEKNPNSNENTHFELNENIPLKNTLDIFLQSDEQIFSKLDLFKEVKDSGNRFSVIGTLLNKKMRLNNEF